MYFIYVLHSKSNDRLYVGRTSNLYTRFEQHIKGKTWTTARMKELDMVFYEAFKAKEDAIRRERYFKTSKGKSSLKQIIRESIK